VAAWPIGKSWDIRTSGVRLHARADRGCDVEGAESKQSGTSRGDPFELRLRHENNSS
jgi:hypothetical protein